MKCKDCALWCESDYCACKDYYTSTDPEQECDEVDSRGRKAFIKARGDKGDIDNLVAVVKESEKLERIEKQQEL